MRNLLFISIFGIILMSGSSAWSQEEYPKLPSPEPVEKMKPLPEGIAYQFSVNSLVYALSNDYFNEIEIKVRVIRDSRRNQLDRLVNSVGTLALAFDSENPDATYPMEQGHSLVEDETLYLVKKETYNKGGYESADLSEFLAFGWTYPELAKKFVPALPKVIQRKKIDNYDAVSCVEYNLILRNNQLMLNAIYYSVGDGSGMEEFFSYRDRFLVRKMQDQSNK